MWFIGVVMNERAYPHMTPVLDLICVHVFKGPDVLEGERGGGLVAYYLLEKKFYSRVFIWELYLS